MDLESKCDMCGDCCRAQKIPLNLLDIFDVSAYLKITPDDFVDRYLTLVVDKEGEKVYIIKEKVCPFLKENSCSIQEVKPTVCKITPCPKNVDYLEFCKIYGAMTLQFLQNSSYEMIRHGLNVEYTHEYIVKCGVFCEATAKVYRQRIVNDLKNRLLMLMLLKNMIQLGVHPVYRPVVIDKLKSIGNNYI